MIDEHRHLSTISDVSKFALNNDLKSGEKKDLTRTKYLGCWNSQKECMEWIELIEDFSGQVEEFFSKNSYVDIEENQRGLEAIGEIKTLIRICWLLIKDLLLFAKVVGKRGRKETGVSCNLLESYFLKIKTLPPPFPFWVMLKTKVVLKITKLSWRRLLCSPTIHYDFSMLELSGAWEPPNSS
jgi:hypothetical protein